MPTEALANDERRTVETFVADWVSDNRIPGAAIAVVDGGGVAYAEGFGARTLEDNDPATPATLFGIGSCTKSVTAAAVMGLVERGEVALDDPVGEYLPHLSAAPGAPITVGELLGHTSGMPSDGSAGPLLSRALGADLAPGDVEVPLSSDADFRRHVEGSVDRRVTDREAFFYYNSGYTLLGKLVERVTGEAFAAHVEDRLLAPLGMDRSTFDRGAFEDEDDRMTPYLKRDGTSTPASFPFDELIHPAGGLLASVEETASWLGLLMGEGSVDGRRLLEPESVAAMASPDGTFGTYLDGGEIGYGYGLIIEEYLGDRLIGHAGSIGVSSAWFGYLEEAGLGVTLACTTTPETHPSDAGMAVLALLRGEEPTDVQPHYRLMDAMETVTGSYEDYRDVGGATVERVGGGLRIEADAGGGPDLVATPRRIEDGGLVCAAVTAAGMEREVRFEIGDDGVDLFFERARLRKAG